MGLVKRSYLNVDSVQGYFWFGRGRCGARAGPRVCVCVCVSVSRRWWWKARECVRDTEEI